MVVTEADLTNSPGRKYGSWSNSPKERIYSNICGNHRSGSLSQPTEPRWELTLGWQLCCSLADTEHTLDILPAETETVDVCYFKLLALWYFLLAETNGKTCITSKLTSNIFFLLFLSDFINWVLDDRVFFLFYFSLKEIFFLWDMILDVFSFQYIFWLGGFNLIKLRVLQCA